MSEFDCFGTDGALLRASRIREEYPWLETWVGPSYEDGPTVGVRIPVGSEIPFLPHSWSLMELHVVAADEAQRDAILAVNGHLGPQVVVGDAPHVSSLSGPVRSGSSRAREAPSWLRKAAARVAGFGEDEAGEKAEMAYHVTYFRNLQSVADDGLSPGGGSAMGRGGYSGHSRGRLFMTEKAGLFFWFGRMEEHASDLSDDPLEDGYVPVVLRFPEPEGSEEDEPGTSDARATSLFSERGVDPSDIELWDGSSWVQVSDWGSLDPSVSFDSEEDDDGEELRYFKPVDDNPLYPG